jgi:hypothetical protein
MCLLTFTEPPSPVVVTPHGREVALQPERDHSDTVAWRKWLGGVGRVILVEERIREIKVCLPEEVRLAPLVVLARNATVQVSIPGQLSENDQQLARLRLRRGGLP